MRKIPLIALGILFGIVATATVFAVGQGFSDIKPTDWFYGPALQAQELGLMKGVNGKFMPGEAVNRAQLAVILQRQKQVINEDTAALLRNWSTVGGLLEGHHLYVYGALFRQIPMSPNPSDDPRIILKDKWNTDGFAKAFDVPTSDKFIFGGFSIYAGSGWQNKRLAEFFIYHDAGSDRSKWYGPFIDDVKRLQGNLVDL